MLAKFRKLKKILSPLLTGWLLVFLLISWGVRQGSVLCIGLDGHIAVEPSLQGNRCSSETAATPKNSIISFVTQPINANYNHCGRCFDISVSPGDSCATVVLTLNKLSQTDTVVYAVSIHSQTLVDTSITKPNCVQHFLASISSPISIRNIILRI